jgi:hypothetical protein
MFSCRSEEAESPCQPDATGGENRVEEATVKTHLHFTN